MSQDAQYKNMEPSSVCEQRLTWIDIFVGTLLSPATTFAQIRQECQYSFKHLPGAFALVVLVCAISTISTSSSYTWLEAKIIFETVAGVMIWLLTLSFVGFMALSFGVEGYKSKACAIALGWSMLPLLFLAPLSCLSNYLGKGQVFFIMLLLWWIFLLQLLAIKQSYKLKIWQAIVLVVLVPFFWLVLQFMQGTQSLAVMLSTLVI